MTTAEPVAAPPAAARAARAALVVGLAMLLVGAAVNPWTVGIWRGERAVDYRDVFALCARWSLALGSLTLLLAWLVRRSGAPLVARLSISWLVVGLLVLADRLVLAVLGLPLWIPDTRAHFRQRPGAVRSVPGASGKLVRIDRHGYHDEEFPTEKPPGEWRALMLGDSVTMGHMLTYEETFSERLEALLDERDASHRSHQVINAGVQGYSVFQELVALEDGLVYAPDFVALGFCMNDVTEPFVVQREYGGTGIDYHGVEQQSNPWLGYLLNETGFGRLCLLAHEQASSAQQRKQWEDFNVRKMVLGSGEPRFEQAWRVVLADLERVYALAAERKLPFVLLVFPYTFQLFDPATLEPQRILREHAARHGVDVLDLTDTFRALVVEDEAEVARLREAGLAAGTPPDRTMEELLQRYAPSWQRYYLDTNHFAPEGHRVVAAELYRYLVQKGLAADEPPH